MIMSSTIAMSDEHIVIAPLARKRLRKAITLEVKAEIVSKHEAGMKVKELSARFKLSHSTVSTILKDKSKYLREGRMSMPMQTIIRRRKGLIPVIEKILLAWINHHALTAYVPLTQAAICAKAVSIFETLKQQHGEEASDETFIASKGWYDRFRKRAGWYNATSQSEPSRIDIETVKNFPLESPSNEALIAIVKQEMNVKEEEIEVVPDLPTLTSQRLYEAFEHIESALKIFEVDDPNCNRSMKVIKAIRKQYACYRKIYNKKRKGAQVQNPLNCSFLMPIKHSDNVS